MIVIISFKKREIVTIVIFLELFHDETSFLFFNINLKRISNGYFIRLFYYSIGGKLNKYNLVMKFQCFNDPKWGHKN
jgi:hypothetical protein